MPSIPLFISLGFTTITALFVYIFYRAARRSRLVLLLLIPWLGLQAWLSLSGFYTVTDTMPPRFLFLIGPPLLGIILLFAVPRGRLFIRSLDPAMHTLMHTLRLPVELVLFGLYTYGTIPRLMTFEGGNLDILSGLSAPLIWYFGFVKKRLSRPVLVTWNVAALLLLLNIVLRAILSAPVPFQQLAFDQPNIAVLHFPYVWLPACIVPMVLLAHICELIRINSKS